MDHGLISVHEKMRDLGMTGSLDSGAGANLPRRERRPGRAAEEAAGLLPTIRLSRPERVLAEETGPGLFAPARNGTGELSSNPG